MKKITKLVLITLMTILVIFPTPIFASGVSISASGGGSINPGGTFTVTISFSGDNVAAFNGSISYDFSKVTCTGQSGGGSGMSFTLGTNGFNGEIQDLNYTGGISGSLSYTFQATSSFTSGSTTVSVSPSSASDNQGNATSCSGGGSVTVTMIQPKSANNNLSSLSVDGNTITNGGSYTTDNSTVTIAASAEDNKASVSGTGSKSLEYGNNSITVTCTAENGQSKQYTFTVVRRDNRSTNNDLASLTVNSSNIYTGSTSYDLPATDDSSISIAASSADSKARVTGDLGSKNLNYGANRFTITCIAENTSSKTYTINITRNDNRSKDNSLSSLKVNGNNILTSSTSYNLGDTDDKTITIEATPTDSKSRVSGSGTMNLNYGDNSFSITCTAENGQSKTYTIHIHRNDHRSTVNTLESLSVAPGELLFNPNQNNYTVIVEHETDTIMISAKATDAKATISGTGKKELSVYSNRFNIVVKAENGATRTYLINVVRKDEYDKAGDLPRNNYLSELSITDLELPFEKETTSYELTVENYIDLLEITALAEDELAGIFIDQSEALALGKNNITITVTAQSGETRSYTIQVNRLDTAPIVPLDKLSGIIAHTTTEQIYIDLNQSKKTLDQSAIQTISQHAKKLVFNQKNEEGQLLYSLEVNATGLNGLEQFSPFFTMNQSYNETQRKQTNYAQGIAIKTDTNGMMPTGAKLRVYVGDQYQANDSLNLYQLDETNNQTSLINTAVVDTDGYLEFTLQKGGSFFITPAELEQGPLTVFGIAYYYWLMILEALLALLFLILWLKARKKAKQIQAQS